jgi:hypothetical protein
MSRKKTYGRTVKGDLITEEFIEKAVKRAEAGYDVNGILRRSAEEKAAPAPDARGQTAPQPRPRRRR